jgi:hypothetical protein
MTMLIPIPPERYARELAPVQSAVFSGRDPEEGAFTDDAWPVVLLLGGLDLDEDVLFALAGAAAGQGDHELVAGYRESRFDDPPVQLPWTPAALEELRTGTVFGHVDVDVFGPSGTWGLVASTENYSVLGAAPAVMEDFLRRVDGGAARLRAEFAQAAADGWIGFGEPGRRYAKALMDRVGWTASS